MMKPTKPGGGTKRQEDKNPIEASLAISCNGGEYLAEFKAPGEHATTPICFPLSELELDLLKVALNDIPFSGTSFQRIPQGTPIVEKLGRLFFTAIFKNGVCQAYKRCLKKAVRDHRQLRLRLIILAREFSVLPLEFLFDPDPDEQSYLCLHPNILLVRTPAHVHTFHPFKVSSLLNILIWTSELQSQSPLDATREEDAIKNALAPLEEEGLVSVTWVRSWDAFQKEMNRETPWHIFHLIGHGTFDTSTEEYCIGIERGGQPGRINAQQLASLLKRQKSLRLVFLSLCEGIHAAALLAQQGIQAVVAQQADVSNEAQIKLVEIFYSKLAQGKPVDVALAKARLEMMLDRFHALEWSTLVLFLSSADALLFELADQQCHPSKSVQQWLTEGRSHYEKAEYTLALKAYRHAVEADQTCAEAQSCLEGLQQEMPLLEKLDEYNAILAEHTDLLTELKRLPLLIELHRPQAALIACEELIPKLGISASPDTWEFVYRCKGHALIELGETDEADIAYARADSYKRLL